MSATLFYTKISKHLELISFLFGGGRPYYNNLLDVVKKLSVFCNVCYNRAFRLLNLLKFSYFGERLK